MAIKNLKKSNGFAASDGLIAVLIIVLFSGLITTIIYNIYLSNASIKRMSIATEYITTVFEYLDKAYYDDIYVDGLATYIDGKQKDDNKDIFDKSVNKVIISSNNGDGQKNITESEDPQYTIEMKIDYYNETEGNQEKLDLVKKLTVAVSYKLGNKDQKIEMSRIKSRENLITPNRPDFSLLNLEDEENAYPIKKVDDKWQVCDEKDINWYNYENGYFATIVVSKEMLPIGEKIIINDFKDAGNMYIWIPRFAYDTTDIKFLYSNTNNYIKYAEGSVKYSVLSGIENSSFKVLQVFETEEQDNVGIWIKDELSSEAYKILKDNI